MWVQNVGLEEQKKTLNVPGEQNHKSGEIAKKKR